MQVHICTYIYLYMIIGVLLLNQYTADHVINNRAPNIGVSIKQNDKANVVNAAVVSQDVCYYII